ncbi:MAG: hypothetical protein V4736_01320 [Bdellovibrionota bacterium]
MKRVVAAALIGLAMSGCSIDASVGDLFPKTDFTNFLSKTQGAEFVSGSTQYQLTPTNGYKVQVSVGNYINTIRATTSGGYTVYSSIQGDMLSDQVQ